MDCSRNSHSNETKADMLRRYTVDSLDSICLKLLYVSETLHCSDFSVDSLSQLFDLVNRQLKELCAVSFDLAVLKNLIKEEN